MKYAHIFNRTTYYEMYVSSGPSMEGAELIIRQFVGKRDARKYCKENSLIAWNF